MRVEFTQRDTPIETAAPVAQRLTALDDGGHAPANDTPFAGRTRLPQRLTVRDDDGAKVGTLANARSALGVVRAAVFEPDTGGFVTAHFPMAAFSTRSPSFGALSIIGEGRGLFEKRYRVRLSERFSPSWISATPRAFRPIGGGRVLYASQLGFAVVDVAKGRLVCRKEFGRLTDAICDLTVSPDGEQMAVALSAPAQDATAEWKYDNRAVVYDLLSGEMSGQVDLAVDYPVRWSVGFAPDGSGVAVTGGDVQRSYALSRK